MKLNNRFLEYKKLGEACGTCLCPPTNYAGKCGPGLECQKSSSAPDDHGKCVEEQSSTGTIFHFCSFLFCRNVMATMLSLLMIFYTNICNVSNTVLGEIEKKLATLEEYLSHIKVSLLNTCQMMDLLYDKESKPKDCCISDYIHICLDRSLGVIEQGVPGVCPSCPSSVG